MSWKTDLGEPLVQPDPTASDRLPVWVRAALAAVILAGAWLRVAWPQTTAFCDDQAHACAMAEDIANGVWEKAGLVNSGRFRNLPGFVYLLAGVWRIWPDPTALLHFVGIANVLAVLAAGVWLRRWVGPAGAWWGAAFLASAPWAIHYSRWIWAQDMLFPAALLTYACLWAWIVRGKQWAALGAVLSLALLVQIHLAGVAVVVAAGLLALWCRPKARPWAVLGGVAVAALSVLPYLLDGQLRAPEGDRIGYRHWWRAFPAAAMSLSGLGWQLEFKDGYAAFARGLSWRRWPYEAVMCLPVGLFGVALVMGVRRLWRIRGQGPAARRQPLSLATALVILIPVSFIGLGLRTSPTYLPMWYPLPFGLMGWAAGRLTAPGAGQGARAFAAPILLAAICGQLLFFAEQLRYVHVHGGVPGSVLGRSYAGMKADVADVAARTPAAEVWMRYQGSSPIQERAAAYLLRHAQWPPAAGGRALTGFGLSGAGAEAPEALDPAAAPPGDAYLVRPWAGTQQREGRIPRRPQGGEAVGPAGMADAPAPPRRGSDLTGCQDLISGCCPRGPCGGRLARPRWNLRQ